MSEIARLVGLLAALAVSTPAVVDAARPRCDPTGVDAEAVAVARRAVEAACACDGFPRHDAYVRCAARVVDDEMAGGRLSARCGKTVRRIHTRSTCSHPQPKVACCEERRDRGRRSCRVRAAERCVDGAVARTACADVAFCADTRCEQLPESASCEPQILYGAEGNRLRRYDLASLDEGPLVDDVLIRSAADAPGTGRDINGQICALPDGSRGFVAGEDTGQPTPYSVGHPQGLAVDCRGNLYYADLALRFGAGGIGPGPNGSVRRVSFDACGTPAAPQIVQDGLAFPDALGLFPGSLD